MAIRVIGIDETTGQKKALDSSQSKAAIGDIFIKEALTGTFSPYTHADLPVADWIFFFGVGNVILDGMSPSGVTTYYKRILCAAAGYTVTLKHLTGTATEQFYNQQAGDVILQYGDFAHVIYDTSIDKWQLVGVDRSVVFGGYRTGELCADFTNPGGIDPEYDPPAFSGLPSIRTAEQVGIVSAAPLTLRSMTSKTASHRMVIANGGTSPITINHNDALGTGYKFFLGIPGPLVLNQGDAAEFYKDTLNSVWSLARTFTNRIYAGDYVWCRSSDFGAASPFWHRLPFNASNRILGRGASGGLKALAPLETRAITDVALAEQMLVDGATIVYDVSLGRNANVTLGGNRVLNITNTVAGQRGVVRVIQDATPPRTLTYQRGGVGADVIFPGGAAPTLTNAVGVVDVLEWYDDGSKIHLKAYSLDSK